VAGVPTVPRAQSFGELARPNATRGLLWRVERVSATGSSETLYLAGSIHALGRTAYPLASAFDQAFEASATLVEELDPDQLAQPDTAADMLAKARLTQGTTLERLVSANTYQRLVAFSDATGLPLAKLRELKPWAIAVTISSLVSARIGLDPALGLDRHFFDRARARNAAFIGLETALGQIDRLDTLPRAVQDHMLLEALRDPAAEARHLTEMVAAWRHGDVGAIEAMVRQDFADAREAYGSLLVERNRAWMPTLDRCLTGLRCFVVVGAAHLVGPDGLVAMLAAKGYRVVQL
jgi:uncharacterized protein YbaP (TraB family)